MSVSFTSKALRVTLILTAPNAHFGNTGNNTLILTGLRMRAKLSGAGNQAITLTLMIFGMLPTDMNQLTVIWAAGVGGPTGFSANTVRLESNDGSGWFTIFEGTINQAQPDYRGIPAANFALQATTGYAQQILTAQPTSSPQASASIAQLAATLVAGMGYKLENNGVTGTISQPYLPGTLMDQFRALCSHANIDFYFAPGNIIAITPRNTQRASVPSVVLSPSSGLKGYPVIQQYGLLIECEFNPAIQLAGAVTVKESDVPSANGIWYPYQFDHDLASLDPDGPWFSTLQCGPASARTQ